VHPVVTLIVGASVFVWANPLFNVIEYWLTESALEVTIFRAVRLARLPYAEIVEVRRARWAELFTREFRWAESLGSNIFRPLVVVRRRTGRRRCAILTPANADAFIRDVRARVASQGHSAAPGSPQEQRGTAAPSG
jgi:hypothetical protein